MLRFSRAFTPTRTFSLQVRCGSTAWRYNRSPWIVRNFCESSTSNKGSTPGTIAEKNRERMLEYIKQHGYGQPDVKDLDEEDISLKETDPGTTHMSEAKVKAEKRVKKYIPKITGSVPTPEEIQRMLEVEHGALDVTIVNVCDKAPFADWMIICSGLSKNHGLAIADGICQDMRACGIKVDGDVVQTYGRDSREWVVVDVGPTVIHVMTEEMREYYRLEKLWEEDEVQEDDMNMGR